MIVRPQVELVGLGVVSAAGMGARALREALAVPPPPFGERELEIGIRTPAAFLTGPPDGLDAHLAVDPRVLRLMSTSSKLAAIAVREALAPRAAELPGEAIGFFLGAGASGDLGDDAAVVLQACVEEGRYSDARFGRRGLRAMHPLKTFLLLTNFTMCHAAMMEETRGPNGVFFSRGSGTVMALVEAAAALADGTCELALAGGADTASTPATLAELRRDGWLARGVIPAEGAALLALQAAPAARSSGVRVEAIAIGRRGAAAEVLDHEVAEVVAGCDLVALLSSEPRAGELERWRGCAGGAAAGLDLGLYFGDALAATPALGWAAAALLLGAGAGAARRIAVVSRGIDRTWCGVRLAAGEAER